MGFVDSKASPAYDVADTARRTGTRWFTIGYVTASPADGCTPRWVGSVQPGRNPVFDNLGALRSQGGDVGLAFGGPYEPELADTCPDADRLSAAYRRMIWAFDVRHIEFEVGVRARDEAAAARRAEALEALQRQAAASGGSLEVAFTLPARPSGLRLRDRRALRTILEAGGEIATVNLRVPARYGAERMLAAVRTARRQAGKALGGLPWRRVGLTPALRRSTDLTVPDARLISDFAARRGLAWLSTRGAEPTPQAAAALAGIG